MDAQGRRCAARERLEFHHRHPFGYGGSHDVGNVRLMCHAHNAYLAEVDYGTRHGRLPAAKPLPAGERNAVSAPRPPATAR